MVGVLPAILMGIDVKTLRAGAQAVLDDDVGGEDAADAPAAMGAALHQALAAEGKLATTILWPYADKLAGVRRLVAAALGRKPGQGRQGLDAGSVLGPVDQHSQLQLFRDGPGNALFTLVSVDTKGKGLAVPRAARQVAGAGLSGRQDDWAIWSMPKPAPPPRPCPRMAARCARSICPRSTNSAWAR